MPLNFEIEVHPFMIKCEETKQSLKTHDAVAIVDGERWNYQVKRAFGYKITRKAMISRAMVYIHYHANNSGLEVEFQEVNNKPTRKKKSIS